MDLVDILKIRSHYCIKRDYYWLLPILIGCISFSIVLGVDVLYPSQIAWLGGGDSYLGFISWLFFRHSSWSLPLGLNPNYGLEIASSIMFNAGGLALFFKPFSQLLPEVFQFTGIWLLGCFVLQSWFSWKIVSIYTHDVRFKCLIAAIVTFSPPMMYRLAIHHGFACHFLLLAAFYLMLQRFSPRRSFLLWMTLILIALVLNFYMFVMIFGLWFLSELDYFFASSNKKLGQLLLKIMLSLGSVAFIGWLVGYFVMGSSSTREFGFGLFRMHLLSIFDSYGWSYLLPAIKTSKKDFLPFNLSDGTYEGFNYLGLGVLMLLIIVLLKLIKSKKSIKTYFLDAIRAKPFLSIYFFGLFLFSLSNNITLGTINLHVPLPEFILSIASILRSSGRLFWPLFYLILISICIISLKIFSRNVAYFLLTLVLFVQVMDTSAGWIPIKKNFHQARNLDRLESLKSPFWKSASERYSNIKLFRLSDSQMQSNWELFSTYAASHYMGTNAVYQARVDSKKVEKYNDSQDEKLLSGNYASDAFYIVSDEWVFAVLKNLHKSDDLFARIDNFNVLAPGWKKCKECFQLTKESEVNIQYPKVLLGEVVPFSRGGKGAKFLIGVGTHESGNSSWNFPESWGIWSEGYIASMALPIPDADARVLNLWVQPYITEERSIQSVEIYLNEKKFKTLILRDPLVQKIQIPLKASDVKRGSIVIKFILPDNISPQRLGKGDDTRSLGLGLVKFQML